MEKSKKIWLGVFLGMVIVPEVLWSPITNFIYELLQNSNHVKVLRDNFINNPDHISSLILCILVQLIGLIFIFLFILKTRFNWVLKVMALLVIIISLVIVGLVFFLVFSLRHGIGF